MPFANWAWFAGGLINGTGSPNYRARLNTTTPIVGAGSMEFHGVDRFHTSDAFGTYYPNLYAYPSALLSPTYKPRGVMRTLVQCQFAEGASANPLSAGIVALTGARQPANRGLSGSYGLMLNTNMASETWDRIILAVYKDAWAITKPPDILMQHPLAGIPLLDTVVALEITCWHWNLDDFGGVRLIGKYGFAPDYSDLTQIFEYMNTDYPTLAQTTGSGIYPGIGCQFDGSVDMDFDETEFDQIMTNPFRFR